MRKGSHHTASHRPSTRRHVSAAVSWLLSEAACWVKCEISNIFSAYMYPQYAEEIVNAVNENFSETPDLEGKSVAAEDDGSLKADWMHLRNDAYGVEMYQNVIDDKVLCYRWYTLGQVSDPGVPAMGHRGLTPVPFIKLTQQGGKAVIKYFALVILSISFFFMTGCNNTSKSGLEESQHTVISQSMAEYVEDERETLELPDDSNYITQSSDVDFDGDGIADHLYI